MAKISGTEYLISSLNDATPWFDLQSVAGDVSCNITGTWVGTITLQVSNQDDDTKTRYTSIETYTTNSSGETIGIPSSASRGRAARFFRFTFTAYTSGGAYIGVAPSYDAENRTVAVTGQSSTGGGA